MNDASDDLHTSISKSESKKVDTSYTFRSGKTVPNVDLNFDTNEVKVVNLMKEQCDILIGRMWPKGHPNPPLAREDYLGNPYVILKPGQEATEPWHCKTREEALDKFKEWL